MPLRDEQGNIANWYGISADIEDLKKAEDRIRAYHRHTSHTWFGPSGLDGAVDYVNQRWLDYTGLLSLKEEIEDPMGAIHPEDLPGVIEKWLKDMAAGQPSEDELRLQVGPTGSIAGSWFALVPLRTQRAGNHR